MSAWEDERGWALLFGSVSCEVFWRLYPMQHLTSIVTLILPTHPSSIYSQNLPTHIGTRPARKKNNTPLKVVR